MPQFSVVIPLYNKEISIVETLRSVISQGFEDIEIIVIDDGSSDGSLERAKEVFDDRIRIISQPNKGESGARNTGILEAKGAYIAFLDADDLWESDHLSTIDALIKRIPDAGVYATRYKVKQVDGFKVFSKSHYPVKEGSGRIVDYFDAMVRCPLFILPSCVVVRADVFNDVGAFTLGQKLGADQDMWSRISVSGYSMALDTNVTVVYREDAENRACVIHRIEEELPFSQNLQRMIDQGDVPTELKVSAMKYIQYHLLNVARDLFWSGNISGGVKQVFDPRLITHPLSAMGVFYCWLRTKF